MAGGSAAGARLPSRDHGPAPALGHPGAAGGHWVCSAPTSQPPPSALLAEGPEDTGVATAAASWSPSWA